MGRRGEVRFTSYPPTREVCWHHHQHEGNEILRTRIGYSDKSFAELGLWQARVQYTGSTHESSIGWPFVVDGVCVVRYDSEIGKGDHRRFGSKEGACAFESPDNLIADFQRDIARWDRENRDS